MRQAAARLLLLAVLGCVVGCIERTETITLNPDGSGKSRIDIILNPNYAQQFGISPDAPVKSLLQTAKGVDVWSDVTLFLDADQQIRFRGTAYFKDISVYRFGKLSNVTSSWGKSPDGGMTLGVKFSLGDRGGMMEGNGHPRKMDAEMTQQIIRLSRNQWSMSRPTIVTDLGQMHMRTVYLLPGRLKAADGLETLPDDDGRVIVRCAVEGAKMIKAVDKFVADDAAMTQAVSAGRLSRQTVDGELTSELIFGRAGTATATVVGELKPQFDYKAETDAARKLEADMLAKLESRGLQPPPEKMEQPLTPQPAP